MTGLTPAKIGRIENAYRDHSTVFDFDTHARELAGMHPELGFDPEDQDTPAKAWELLKAGKIKKVSLEQIAQFAADMVAKELRPKPLKQVVLGEADDSFGGHGGFDPDKFSRLESAVMRYSGQRGLFDEEDHPRASKGGAKGGQFIAIHSGHTVEGGPVHVGESSRQHGEWVYSHEVSSMTPEHRAAYTESLAGRKPERTYRNADGSPLPPSVAEEIKALKIRPDLKDVRLVRNEHGELKGSGKDSKGRSQPIYPSAHRARKDAEKFERIRQFTKQIGDIRKRVEADLQSPDAAKREAAFLAYLIDKTGMRIGSDKDTGAEKEATGATTLEAKHVHIDGDHVTMDFVGKSGHDNHWEVNDPLIASELAKRMPSGKERLFSVNDAQFRKYMNGVAPGFKPAKDFRTAVAADHAMKAIATMPVPKTAVEYRNALGQVAESVSSRINNTPDVAFKSYIPPEVFGAWQANLLSNGIDVTALKPSYPKAMSIPVPMKSSPPKTRAGGMTTTMKMIPKTTEGYSRLETARAAASVHRYGGPAATADPICRARDRPPSVRGSARSG